ncbi:MAG: ATP-binding cassette domain-containing protein [Candidatus Devosia euplotis]|nr:ATP-binding cassette domain-containing protein [Candidatus Devosia euplotis]
MFQDPFSSLNPRQRVKGYHPRPLDIHKVGSKLERESRAAELMQCVGLRPDQADAFPNQFSGGQRQRIGIARALALSPISSSVTSRFRRSTCRCRRKFSTCRAICSVIWGYPIWRYRMIWAWWNIFRTVWR